MAVPLAGFLIAWSFPVYLNMFKAQELDGYRAAKVGIVNPAGDSESQLGGVNEKGYPPNQVEYTSKN